MVSPAVSELDCLRAFARVRGFVVETHEVYGVLVRFPDGTAQWWGRFLDGSDEAQWWRAVFNDVGIDLGE